MPFVYVLHSVNLDRFYIGSTNGPLHDRLSKHQSQFFGLRAFTAKTNDWVLFWSMETSCVIHARRLEAKIKSMKSKIYIHNLVKFPELAAKLYNDTL